MKYLKNFNESLTNEDEIRRLCYIYNIENYTINEDGSIDVPGEVGLSFMELDELPLKFRNVSGNFYCDGNYLTNLNGSPHRVGGGFYCHNNQLTTLKGCPKNVGGGFSCSINKLISLEFCPESVGDGFYCNDNQLTSLRYCPKSVGGYFNCSENKLTSLKYIPKRINDVLYCTDNKIKNIDYLPYCNKIYIGKNPISLILNLFDYDIDLIFDFKEREIIQEDILLMDRLVEFLEDIGEPRAKDYLQNLLENEYETR